MKVLMDEGNVLTLPFTLDDRSPNSFDQLAVAGTATTGTVSTIEDSALRVLVNRGASPENSTATPAELMRDLRFIHKVLLDVAAGAEVGIESTRTGYKLLIPETARAPREMVAVGDRCAFNARARGRRCCSTPTVWWRS